MDIFFALVGAGYIAALAIAGILWLTTPRDTEEANSLREMAPDLFPDED